MFDADYGEEFVLIFNYTSKRWHISGCVVKGAIVMLGIGYSKQNG